MLPSSRISAPVSSCLIMSSRRGAFHAALFTSFTQRGVLTPALRVGPDHSLVSASARFTVLRPGPKA